MPMMRSDTPRELGPCQLKLASHVVTKVQVIRTRSGMGSVRLFILGMTEVQSSLPLPYSPSRRVVGTVVWNGIYN